LVTAVLVVEFVLASTKLPLALMLLKAQVSVVPLRLLTRTPALLTPSRFL
jgi:hypothetical protein